MGVKWQFSFFIPVSSVIVNTYENNKMTAFEFLPEYRRWSCFFIRWCIIENWHLNHLKLFIYTLSNATKSGRISLILKYCGTFSAQWPYQSFHLAFANYHSSDLPADIFFQHLFPMICSQSEPVLLEFWDWTIFSSKIIYEHLYPVLQNPSINKEQRSWERHGCYPLIILQTGIIWRLGWGSNSIGYDKMPTVVDLCGSKDWWLWFSHFGIGRWTWKVAPIPTLLLIVISPPIFLMIP